MANEPEVTVNISGSIEGLKKSLADASAMVDNWAKTKIVTPDISVPTPKPAKGGGPGGTAHGGSQSESIDIDKMAKAIGEAIDYSKVNIKTHQGSKSTLPLDELPSHSDPAIQLAALISFNDRLAEIYEKLDAAGRGTSDRANKVAESMDSSAMEIERLTGMGYKPAKPSGNQGGLPAIPSMHTDEEQYDALLEQGKLLDALLAKYQSLGQGGSDAAKVLEERVGYINASLEDLDAKLGKSVETAKKPVKEAKPPPLPEPPPIPDPGNKVAESLERVQRGIQLVNSAGVRTGSLGTLASRLRMMTASAGAAIPAILGVAAVAGVLVVSVVAVTAAIAGAIKMMKDGIAVAKAYALEMAVISNALGSTEASASASATIDKVTAGTGIDPAKLRALLPELEAKGRGKLSGEGGLSMVATVAANLDPSKVQEYGSAIASAADSIYQSGTVTEGALQSMVQLGMISGEAARELVTLQRTGVTGKQVWSELQQAMNEAAYSGEDATKSVGSLMDRLSMGIGSAWDKTLRAIGDRITTAIGPALEKLIVQFEQFLPHIEGVANYAMDLMEGVLSWVSGVLSGAAKGLSALQSMFQNGDIHKFMELGMSLALVAAANTFVNNLARSYQFLADVILQPFRLVTNGSFWEGLGSTLMAIVYSAMAVISSVQSVAFNALSPVINWLAVTFDLIGSKFAGWILTAVSKLPKVLLGGKDSKDALAAEGKALRNKTREQSEAEVKGGRIGSAMADIKAAASELTTEWATKAGAAAKDGLTGVGKGFWESSALSRVGDHKTPDLLKGTMDELKGQMGALIDKNATPFEFDKPDFPSFDLDKSIGQGGPKAVVDSLQSVGGGGGFFASLSIEEKILEENKKQTQLLGKGLEGKTPMVGPEGNTQRTASVSGAFGGGADDKGPTATTILLGISALVGAILGELRSSGGGSKQGSLVTVR